MGNRTSGQEPFPVPNGKGQKQQQQQQQQQPNEQNIAPHRSLSNELIAEQNMAKVPQQQQIANNNQIFSNPNNHSMPNNYGQPPPQSMKNAQYQPPPANAFSTLSTQYSFDQNNVGQAPISNGGALKTNPNQLNTANTTMYNGQHSQHRLPNGSIHNMNVNKNNSYK